MNKTSKILLGLLIFCVIIILFLVTSKRSVISPTQTQQNTPAQELATFTDPHTKFSIAYAKDLGQASSRLEPGNTGSIMTGEIGTQGKTNLSFSSEDNAYTIERGGVCITEQEKNTVVSNYGVQITIEKGGYLCNTTEVSDRVVAFVNVPNSDSFKKIRFEADAITYENFVSILKTIQF